MDSAVDNGSMPMAWRNALGGLALLAALGVGYASAEPREREPREQTANIDFDVPAGRLDQAIVRFGQQAGVQFGLDPALAEGRSTPGLSGRHSTASGLRSLLAGSGLTFRFTGPHGVVLAPRASGELPVISPLRIEGAGAGAGFASGSSDITATEGSDSYLAPLLGVGTKSAGSIKETPQSVSAVTQQQISDQKITGLADVLERTPGVTLRTDGGRSYFYSRGFELDRLQIDGGAPIDIGRSSQRRDYRYTPHFDMALYDHVELLRGADGLFNGNGTVGGIVNLVRKRPLERFQATWESSAGSWDHYRNTLDVTGPLALDGALRGRLVAVSEDRRYFYDRGDGDKRVISGVLETDLGADTRWRLGANHTREKSNPWYGLPRYATGEDLGLPRRFSTIMPWDNQNARTTEYYTQLDHDFNPDWRLNVNATRLEQRLNGTYSVLGGSIDPNGDGATLAVDRAATESRQSSVDGFLDGAFSTWGLQHQLTIGGNYSRLSSPGRSRSYYYLEEGEDYVFRELNIFRLHNSGLHPPVFDSLDQSTRYNDEQWGAYARASLSLWDGLRFMTGIRYNSYRSLVDTSLLSYTYSEKELQRPYYALAYDFTPSWTGYVSYTDINQSQASLLTDSRRPLDPLVGSNKEVGVKYQGGALAGSLSVYRIEQKNEAQLTNYDWDTFLGGGPSCCYMNNPGKRISEGIDLELNGELLDGLQVTLGYSYNHNEYRDGTRASGSRLSSFTPEHMLKLWSAYSFSQGSALHGWRIGGGFNAQTSAYSEGTVWNDVIEEDVPYEFTQGFHMVTSVFADYQITPHWSLSMNLNNLFDRRYYETTGSSLNGNYYGTPRSYLLTLKGTL